MQARSPLEPVAIIEQATLPSQRVISGAASGILQQALEKGIRTPAVIVIGKVVDEREVSNSLAMQEVAVCKG